jgi:hypothetical protein
VTNDYYNDSGLDEDRYYYKIRAVDKAGNTSDYVATSFDLDGGSSSDDDDDSDTCNLTLTVDVPDYVSAGPVQIEISANRKMSNSTLKVRKYGLSYTASFEGYKYSGETTSFTKTYTFAEGDDGTADAFIVAYDASGNMCSKTKEFVVDTNAPTVSWVAPSANDTVTQSAELKVKAVDETDSDEASGVKQVTFYYGETEIDSVTDGDENDHYVLDWDMNGVVSGNYTLKAEVEDRAGNTAQALVTVTLQPLTGEAADALNAINQAKADQNLAENKIAALEADSIFIPEAVLQSKENADDLLADAESLYGSSNYTDAETKAESAQSAYQQININLGATTDQTDDYTYDKSDMEALFAGAGLSEDLIEEAVLYGENNEVSRQLQVSQVTDNSGVAYYTVSVIMTYKNSGTETQSIQVVEVIPKSFAASTDDLISNLPFEVVEKDPVIKFDLGLVGAGQETTVTYGLAKSLSQAAAEGMIDSDVVGQFKSPPIVLDSLTAFDADSIASTATYDYSFLVIVVVVIFVLALIIILGGGYLVYTSHSKEEPTRKRFEYAEAEEKSFGGFLNETFGTKKEKEGLDKFR